MQKIEFEERTGLKLTEDGYKEVEECYMNTDLDKDTFCELWIKNPTALKEIERKTVLVRELYEERKCLVNFLIEQAEKWSASDIYPVNHRATEIAHTNNAIFLFDYIAGDVVLCEDKEVQ